MIGWKWPTFIQSDVDTILTMYRPAVHSPHPVRQWDWDRSWWFIEHFTSHNITSHTQRIRLYTFTTTHWLRAHYQQPTKINKGFCYRYNTHGRSHTWSQARSYSNCGKYLDKKQTNIKCYWQRPSVSPSMIFTPLKRISIGVKKYRNPDKFFNVILKISTSWTWIVLHSWAFLYFPLYLPPYAILCTQEVWVLTPECSF